MKSNPTKTILTISLGFLTLYILFKIDWSLYVSFVISLIGFSSTFLSSKIEILWFKISKILSYIIPNILLSLIFYFLLFPVSLLSKIFNEKSIKKSLNKKSMYTINEKRFSEKSFINPW